MAAPLVVPTFRGFVATTVDAALLVEAAIAGRLPHVADRPDNAGYRQLARSGTVVVFGPGIQRWREGLSWSARRALGNGFDVYRETSETHKLSERDQRNERRTREVLAPFVGPNVGIEKSKRNGLVKKTIAFTIGGQRWGLVAYYTLFDAAFNVLHRPRNDPALGQMLLAGGLNPEFWEQVEERSARARAVVMVDDANAHPASRSPMWSRAGAVAPAQFAPPPAANVVPAAPFVGPPLAPPLPPAPTQQPALPAAGGNFAAPSGPAPSGPAPSGPFPSAPAGQQQQASHQHQAVRPAALPAAAAGGVPPLPFRPAPLPSAGAFPAPSFSSPPAGDDDFFLPPEEADAPFLPAACAAPLPAPESGNADFDFAFGMGDWLGEVPRLLDGMLPPPPPFPPALAAAGGGQFFAAGVGGGGVVHWEEEVARVMDQIGREVKSEFTEEDLLRFFGGGGMGEDVVMEDV